MNERRKKKTTKQMYDTCAVQCCRMNHWNVETTGKKNSVCIERKRELFTEIIKRCRVCVNTHSHTDDNAGWALHWYLFQFRYFSYPYVRKSILWLHLIHSRQQSSVIRNTFTESEAQNLLFSSLSLSCLDIFSFFGV